MSASKHCNEEMIEAIEKLKLLYLAAVKLLFSCVGLYHLRMTLQRKNSEDANWKRQSEKWLIAKVRH